MRLAARCGVRASQERKILAGCISRVKRGPAVPGLADRPGASILQRSQGVARRRRTYYGVRLLAHAPWGTHHGAHRLPCGAAPRRAVGRGSSTRAGRRAVPGRVRPGPVRPRTSPGRRRTSAVPLHPFRARRGNGVRADRRPGLARAPLAARVTLPLVPILPREARSSLARRAAAPTRDARAPGLPGRAALVGRRPDAHLPTLRRVTVRRTVRRVAASRPPEVARERRSPLTTPARRPTSQPSDARHPADAPVPAAPAAPPTVPGRALRRPTMPSPSTPALPDGPGPAGPRRPERLPPSLSRARVSGYAR